MLISQAKKGSSIIFRDEAWKVLKNEHYKPGKGRAFSRLRLKNIKTGGVIDHTFSPDERVSEPDIEKKKLTFLYKEGASLNFMDNESYDQFSLDEGVLGVKKKFLKENSEVVGLFLDNEMFDVELMPKMVFEVVSAPPGVRGNSAQAGTKIVEIETGGKVEAPLFVKEGDRIKVNTETGGYVERVK